MPAESQPFQGTVSYVTRDGGSFKLEHTGDGVWYKYSVQGYKGDRFQVGSIVNIGITKGGDENNWWCNWGDVVGGRPAVAAPGNGAQPAPAAPQPAPGPGPAYVGPPTAPAGPAPQGPQETAPQIIGPALPEREVLIVRQTCLKAAVEALPHVTTMKSGAAWEITAYAEELEAWALRPQGDWSATQPAPPAESSEPVEPSP